MHTERILSLGTGFFGGPKRTVEIDTAKLETFEATSLAGSTIYAVHINGWRCVMKCTYDSVGIAVSNGSSSDRDGRHGSQAEGQGSPSRDRVRLTLCSSRGTSRHSRRCQSTRIWFSTSSTSTTRAGTRRPDPMGSHIDHQSACVHVVALDDATAVAQGVPQHCSRRAARATACHGRGADDGALQRD